MRACVAVERDGVVLARPPDDPLHRLLLRTYRHFRSRCSRLHYYCTTTGGRCVARARYSPRIADHCRVLRQTTVLQLFINFLIRDAIREFVDTVIGVGQEYLIASSSAQRNATAV